MHTQPQKVAEKCVCVCADKPKIFTPCGFVYKP